MAKKTEAEIERLKKNNARLRELVAGSGLSQPEALKVFNKRLGPIGSYSPDAWKSFLAGPEAKKLRLFGDDLLAHAEKVFDKLKKPD
jgi:hypothetical protein